MLARTGVSSIAANPVNTMIAATRQILCLITFLLDLRNEPCRCGAGRAASEPNGGKRPSRWAAKARNARRRRFSLVESILVCPRECGPGSNSARAELEWQTGDRRPDWLIQREGVKTCLDENRDGRIGPVPHCRGEIGSERRYAQHAATMGLVVRSVARMLCNVNMTTMRSASWNGAAIGRRFVLCLNQAVNGGRGWNEGNPDRRSHKTSQRESGEKCPDAGKDTFGQPTQHCLAISLSGCQLDYLPQVSAVNARDRDANS